MRFLARSLALLGLFFAVSAHAADLTLQNDGFVNGANLGFQGGFVAGEIGAVRLHPPDSTPRALKKVQFLFGGAAGTREITLRIYDDAGLTTIPGLELYAGVYQVTASDTAMQEIDLTGLGITVSGPFRVGIEFSASGAPSIARDGDGTINAARNFIFASGFGWVQSNLLGLTGDWIVRAVVGDVATTYTVGGTVNGLQGTLILQNNGGDDLVVTADGPFVFSTPLANGASYDVSVLSAPASQDCVVIGGSGTIAGANVTDIVVNCSSTGTTLLANDGFAPGGSAGFQSGFVAGEIAAARLHPPDATPRPLQSVQFLFGGAAGTRDVDLHVYDDSGLGVAPGTEIFSAPYQITASDTALQVIDLSAMGIVVSGPFRVGIEFSAGGVPSIARDDDGTIAADRNTIFAGGLGWVTSASLGLTGDWIIRAVVGGEVVVAPDDPLILSVADIGNDQGRSVRIRFAASAQDSPLSPLPVLRYEAFRRIDPLPKVTTPLGKRLDGWEFVGSVPSHGESVYNLVAPTLADSTAAGTHWSVFFIRAATASPFVFYDSPADSGYSIDNLAPAAPQNLSLVGNTLAWDPAPESDFDYWSIYGADDALPGTPRTLLGSTISNGFTLTGTQHAWLLVTAHDFSGNEGAPAIISNQVVGVETPLRHVLSLKAAPNPFNPATRIEFENPVTGPLRLQIFDLRGRLVETLIDDAVFTAGMHHVDYRSELASGTYVLRIENGERVASIKMGLVR